MSLTRHRVYSTFGKEMRILFILVGAIGLGISSPFSWFGWMMHKGFGGTLTGGDTLILLAPLCFVAILITGFCIPRETKK